MSPTLFKVTVRHYIMFGEFRSVEEYLFWLIRAIIFVVLFIVHID